LPGRRRTCWRASGRSPAQGERLVGLSAIAQSMTAVLEQLRVGLDRAGFEQRRQLVELLIDRVVVTDGKVEIRYVIPTTPGSTNTRFCHLRTDYFHLIPVAVTVPIKGRRPSATGPLAGTVGLLVITLRNRVPDVAGAQRRPVGATAVGLVAGQLRHPGARPAASTRAGHPHGVHQPDQLDGVGVLARGQPGGQVAAATITDGVELGRQPPRDRPSACCRLAWIEPSPLCGRRRRAGGRAPRWSRSGRPSPAPQHRRPGCARPPRSVPRSHRFASVQLHVAGFGSQQPRSGPVAMGRPAGAALVAVGTDLLGGLGVDQGLQHQRQRLADNIQATASAQRHQQVGHGRLVKGHRGESPWCAPWQGHTELHAMALALLLSRARTSPRVHHFLGHLPAARGQRAVYGATCGVYERSVTADAHRCPLFAGRLRTQHGPRQGAGVL
jgi:hypothetical protein